MRVVIGVTGCWLVCCCCASLDAAPPASPPTVEQILQELEKEEAILFAPEGFICRVQRTKCVEVTPSRYSSGYLDTEFLVVHKGDRWLTHKKFLNVAEEITRDPGGNKLYTPREPDTYVMRDHLFLNWREGKERAWVAQFAEGWGGAMFQCMDYFTQLGFDATKHLAQSAGADYSKARKLEPLQDYLGHPFFPDFLRENKVKYRVLPEPEEVRGSRCWVLEYPGMDKAWLDPARGYAVCRRIYHWGPGQPRKFEIANLDFEQYVPGLWLPQKQIVDKYASIKSEDRSIWDKVACRLTYEVVEMTFGSVPDEAVDRKIPPGTLIDDYARNLHYRVAAQGEDPLSGPIAEAHRRGSDRRPWIFAGIVVLLIAAAAATTIRRRRKG